MELAWFLPLSTDVRHIGQWPEEGPDPTLDRLVAITEAAESAGCAELLVPTAYVTWLETFTAAAAVLARTGRARLLLAVRPNQFHPAQLAKLVLSLDLLFPGRVRLNVTTGGWDEDRWIGAEEDRDRRNRRLREWLEILDLIWYGEHPVRFDGEFYRIEGTMTVRRLSGRVPIALSGSSPAVRQSLVEHGDSYLLFGAPPEQVAAEIERLRSTPGYRDDITVGLRTHVVVRPTEAEAWAAAEDIVSRVDPRARELVAASRTDPASQRAAQLALAGARELVVSPNLWAGIGTARFGAATALVGDPEQIVDRLEEYAGVGVDSFILSGYPKLEEAVRFGQLVTPLLRRRGLL